MLLYIMLGVIIALLAAIALGNDIKKKEEEDIGPFT